MQVDGIKYVSIKKSGRSIAAIGYRDETLNWLIQKGDGLNDKRKDEGQDKELGHL